MKIFGLIMGTALIAILIIGMSIELFEQTGGNSLYENQAYLQLLNIAESKAERITDFISNRKNDASFLAGSEDVSNVFDEELSRDVKLMQEKIRVISKKTAEDIGRYLLENPDISLKDLQNSEEFWRIAVRDVGETGYTYLNSMGEGVLYFHPDPNSRGKSYHAWKDIFPLIWKYNENIAQSVPCEDSYGFYNWKDITGKIREKFTYHSCVEGKTADDYSFYVGASTYLDEYGGSISLAHDLYSELKSFQTEKGYVDIILINPDGNVIWTAEKNNELGTNLITGIYNNILLSNVFREAKDNLEISVSDSGIYGINGKLKLFVTAPVIGGNGELRGVVALQLDNDRISSLVKTDVLSEDIGEVYIVNHDFQHISPLRHDDVRGSGDPFHTINSERIEVCLQDCTNHHSDFKNENVEKIENFGTYLNYYDKDPSMVLGAHAYIPESEWCIVAEMDQDYFLSITPNYRKLFLFVLGFVLFFLFVTSLVLENLLSIKKGGSRK